MIWFEQCRGWGTTPQTTENPRATLLLVLSMVGIHPSMDSTYLVKKKSMYKWTHAVQTHVKGQQSYKMTTPVSWINIHHLTQFQFFLLWWGILRCNLWAALKYTRVLSPCWAITSPGVEVCVCWPLISFILHLLLLPLETVNLFFVPEFVFFRFHI